MRVLVTGGAGYIGSHACKELARQGHDVIVFDNLSTGHHELVKWGAFAHGDILDLAALRRVMRRERVEGVIHFAAKSQVGESVRDPGLYVRNNVGGTLNILEAMRDEGVPRLVVSGTCAVYGQPERVPITEDAPLAPVSPYGATKLFMERMLADFAAAHGIASVVLRYFNAAGADPEGESGEWHDPETHLIPRALMAVAGTAPALELFGSDYPTPDGTCLRDYIDIVDLARAHVAAVKRMTGGRMKAGYEIFNVGTGRPVSVLELVEGFEKANGLKLNYKIVGRRAGDVPAVWADTDLANRELGWKAERSLEETLRSAWAWEKHVRGME